MKKVIVNSDKYNGKYVAIISPEDNTVVGSGDMPDESLKEAARNGYKSPYIIYVPERNLVLLNSGAPVATS